MKKVLVSVLVGMMMTAIVACSGKNYSKISWSDLELGEVLPSPGEKITGEIQINDDKSLQVVVAKVSADDFSAYIEKCEESGFDLNAYSNDDYYSADNSSGYGVSIDHDTKEKTMIISVNAYNIYGEFKWPDSEIAKLLPVPKSDYGVVDWENSDGFVANIANTSVEDFNEYISACKEKGFTVDYQAGDDFYYANDEGGNKLALNYKEGDVMFVRIDKPETEMTETTMEDSSNSGEETAATMVEDSSESNEEAAISADSDIRPEFKEAMDSYEAFFDEYCEFMKKYKESNNAASMLGDYTDYMTKYTDAMTKMSELNNGKLSNEEIIYYSEVTARITKKLTEVAQ